MKKRRLLSILLSLCVILAFMPQMAFAETTSDGFSYTVSDEGVTITGYSGSTDGVEIPAEIDGKQVTAIGDRAFCTYLTSVTIPVSVITIGNEAFSNCTGLESITVAAGNTYYSSEEGVLFNKGKSELIQYPAGKTGGSYTIPNDVTTIGDSAFYSCQSLTSVTIPNGVTTIGDSAFYECRSLESVTIPSGVTVIGDSAFYHCSKLTSVEIPASVTTIGNEAFSDCTDLTSIKVAGDNTYYSSEDGVLFNKNKSELIQYPAGKVSTSYTIPNGVASIGDSAFYHCQNLTSVTIPAGVTTIGDEAFYTCSELTSVTIPNGVTTIGSLAFYNCTKLTSLEIPASVTTIGNEAFSSCTGLTSITVADGNTNYSSDGGVLFNKDKSELIQYPAEKEGDSYTIPNDVTSIGDSAFEFCQSLKSITIPSGVTTIGGSAFYQCTSLESVKIPSGVTAIGDSTFKNCVSLTSVKIPSGVTTIGYLAFCTCLSLASVEIPDSVTSIGDFAFSVCGGLISIFLPDNDGLSIGHNAIPETTSQVKYSLDKTKDEVTVSKITLGEGKTSVDIPETICGYPVVAVLDSSSTPVYPTRTDSVTSAKDGSVTVTLNKSITTSDSKTTVTVTDTVADQIIAKLASSESKSVVIDASAGSAASTAVEISESSLKKLAEVEGIEITLVTNSGRVVLDNKTLESVAASAGNDGQVTLNIETVEKSSNLLKVDISISTSGGYVTEFNGGKVTVTVVIDNELKGKKPACVYIDDKGKYFKIGGTLNEDGTFTFVTGHFSTYAIMPEADADKVIKEQEIAAVKKVKSTVTLSTKNVKKGIKVTVKVPASQKADKTGIIIYRSTKKNSGYAMYKKVKTSGTTYTVTNTLNVKGNRLVKGKRYYYKARVYKVIDGKTYYGPMSSVKYMRAK